jgi:hypothetical protein
MSYYTRPITTTLLDSGLAGNGLGVTVFNQFGAVLITRITTGIVESGDAIYSVSIPNWNTAWTGFIQWDNSGTVLAQEDFVGDLGAQSGILQVPDYSPSLNAYITVYDANLYFQTRLGTDAWDSAIPTDQTKALAQATRSIDRLNFIGIKANPCQSFQWPRIVGPRRLGTISASCLPNDIQVATAELALNLLDGIDADLEDELLGSQSDAYATVRVTSDSKVARDHIKAGIVSAIAWRLLLPWLQDPRAITLRKG